MNRYTIFRMDLSDGSTKALKTVDTKQEADRKVASFQRLVTRLENKSSEDWKYFWKMNETG
jgi:hypothetical protein